MNTFINNPPYDFIIIGSGIVGTNIARELSKYQTNVLVLEQESDIVNGQTIANSGIIHSGHDPKAGTLKAQLCVEGNHLTHELSQELGFHLLECGALVLAFSPQEESDLLALYENAKINQVPGVELLSKEQVLALEPKINNTVIRGLSLPTTSVCSPWEMAIASMENAVLNSVAYRVNAKVTSIVNCENYYEVEINREEKILTRHIINASGLHSEEVGLLIDPVLEYHLIPRKGEYFTLDPKNRGAFNHVLYPMPTERGKGVLVTPQVHGETLVGPTSEAVSGHDNEVSARGLASIVSDAVKISKHLQFYDNIRNFAGVRAKSTYEDFYIKESAYNRGVYHLGGIDSPGLTAAPAIAKYLIKLIEKHNILVPKTNYIVGRNYQPLFRYLSKEEKQKALKLNPLHGNVICKCENITEADIINAISNEIIPADTVKAVKKRTRAGAGICQGGYCERHVIKLISELRHKKMTSVDYYEQDTAILLEDLKEST